MQAVLTNTIKLIKNSVEKKFPKEVIPYLLKAVENADNKTRNDIENQIVKIGESAIPELVNALSTSTGTTRAVAAMALIRLGKASAEYLKSTYKNNQDFQWVVNYISNEIEGTQRPLGQTFEYTEVLAG